MSSDVLYVCQRFPWVTQTFTVREVGLLRERGIDVRVASFNRPSDDLLDEAARALVAVTTFVPPPYSTSFVAGVLAAFVRRPLTMLRLLVLALSGSGQERTDWQLRARNTLAVARGAWISRALREVRLLHAEFADEACTAAMAASELTGKPFSFKSHASFNPQLLNRKARRACFVATESEFDRRTFFGDLPDNRVLVNHGGVVVSDTPRPETRDSTVRILSVGTLQEKKGHRHLIRALGVLRRDGVQFRCLIIGSGGLEQELRAAVTREGVAECVTIDPYRPHDEVVRLYREYDIFALPCVVTAEGDRDGIPNVLIEAAAARCALVSTPVSGIPELVVDGVSGLLVPERDEFALAAALERLASDPVLRERLAVGAGRIAAARFDLVRNVDQLAGRFRLELSRASERIA